jgi:hypothetical protein
VANLRSAFRPNLFAVLRGLIDRARREGRGTGRYLLLGSAALDLLRQSVTVYRHIEESSADQDSGYRQQTIIEIPVIRHQGEPLQLQLQHFLGLIAGSGDPALELDSLLPPHRVVARVGESAGTLVGV